MKPHDHVPSGAPKAAPRAEDGPGLGRGCGTELAAPACGGTERSAPRSARAGGQARHGGERHPPWVGLYCGSWLCSVTLPRSAGSRGLPYCCIITTVRARAQMMISFSFYGWFRCWQAMSPACIAALAFRRSCFIELSPEPGMPGSEPHAA